jgi:flagellar motor switch protein FliM
MTESVGYSEQATSVQRRRRGEARAYDFRRPVRLAREHAHLLRIAMQTFSRQAATVLTTSLRVVSSIGGIRIEELSYDEFLSGLPEQTVCAVITLEPLAGKALFAFDLPTVLTMVDHQLGGPGGDQPDRPLTDIEQALFRQLMQRMLRELTYALESIAEVRSVLSALENDARFVQAAALTDPVVVARLDVTVGNQESTAGLCLPYAMLSPALEQLSNADESGEKARLRTEAARRTQQRLSDVLVDVAVRFDPLRLPSRTIAELKVGDVLTLGHRTTTPLSVTSAATTFARAVPGSAGRRLAVLIVPEPRTGGAP